MRYGLIGKKLSHSYSCEIHALIAAYDYELKELAEDELAEFFVRREFSAINVTIPYKQSVIKYLDEISEDARRIGAVNTVVNYGGRLVGYNTDYFGMASLFEKLRITPKDKKALILGTGGTSNTAFAVLSDLGATKIVKVSRSAKDGAITYEEALKEHSDAQIIVNCTPCGMYPDVNGLPICVDSFFRLEGVLDAIYNPLCTRLVLNARKRGAVADGGLYMLVAQAIKASRLFLQKDTDVEKAEIDEIYDKILAQKQNVALVGMPSCGKSTIGRRIAEITGREFVDTDEKIVEKTDMPISEYFAKFGEESFRKIESEIIEEEAKKSGVIIATGGGSVLKENNVTALKRNGVIVFLDREINKLVATADRPLSRSLDDVRTLYEQRYEIYCDCADLKICANGSVAEVAESLIKELKI